MELRALTLTDKEMEIEVLGENETFLNPIKQKLLADKDVDIAEYVIEHPFLSIPRIYLRTRGGAKAQVVLQRTVKALLKEYKEFEDAFVAQAPTQG
jgi:DNA-directed RNA polymerase subunit L